MPPEDKPSAPSPRTRVRREAHRGVYDRASIDAILDAALICHLAFIDDGQPFAVPTLQARVGDVVYVHGSAASRALRILRAGATACLTATLVDGLVMARSVFEHSINYRSVMILGSLRQVDDPDHKVAALKAFTEKLAPGRWAEARQPTAQELAATSILAMPITEASAKVRSGPPEDAESEDGALDVWAGVLPIQTHWATPVPDPRLRAGIPLPDSVVRLVAGEDPHQG
ncbi:MAG: pyridoxamine 5'-phosphate oxidase family protein [Actinomycetota bacterium]